MRSGTAGFGDPEGTITGKNFGENQLLVQTPVPLVRFLVRVLVRIERLILIPQLLVKFLELS